MPDSDGKMTNDEVTKLKQWFESHLRQPVCAMCTTNQWIIVDTIQNLQSFVPGVALKVGGPTVPTVALSCAHCGHIVFFSAVLIGLLPAEEPKAPPATPSPEAVNGG